MDAKELDWVHQHLRVDKAAQEDGGGGFLRAMIDTIIGNLQLSITNVHVRYEVPISLPYTTPCCAVGCVVQQQGLEGEQWHRRIESCWEQPNL